MPARRAKKGGETVGGKAFKGGQFIGMDYILKETGGKFGGKIIKAADRSVFKNVRHAAFSIRKTIRSSIKKRKSPSAAGDAVATRGKRGNIRNSVFASADKETAVIGPRYSMTETALEAHEFGKTRGGKKFDKRPTTGPGLEANTDRFANSFAGSIGE